MLESIFQALFVACLVNGFIDLGTGLIAKDVKCHFCPFFLDILDEHGNFHGTPYLLWYEQNNAIKATSSVKEQEVREHHLISDLFDP